MTANNKVWAEKLIKRSDPSFKDRWVIYEDVLSSLISKEKIWVDIGCGENQIVEKHVDSAKLAIGVDTVKPHVVSKSPFVCSDLYNLPFPSQSVDLATLRFVVEHLEDIPGCFAEINRMLKPGGKILILTTNIWSPYIFVPALFPFWLKKLILKKVYGVEEEKILKTYHKLNSVAKFKTKRENLRLVKIDFAQDANYVRKWVFLVFFLGHIISKPKFLRRLRTNIIAVYEKTQPSQPTGR